MSDNFSIFEVKFSENAIISFDLFDTLIESPFLFKEDLFELMSLEVDKIVGKKNFDFKKIRILAEKNAYKAKNSSGIIDLNNIYSELQRLTQLGNAYVMEIEKLELVYIQKYYQPKLIGKQIFEFAQSLNKKIVILAETYYPRFVLESILDKCDYNWYQELFISAEIELSTQKGTMFPYVADKLQCSPKYIVHIGDDEIADVVNAEKAGFNTLPILSSKESYKNSLYYKEIWGKAESQHILSTRLINGMLSLKFFLTNKEEGLNTDKSCFNQDFKRIGYFGLGPILLGFTQWILQKSQEDYVKHLYFLSSNGKFLKSSYDLLAKHYSQAPTAYDLLSSGSIESFSRLNKNHELYEILDLPYANITIKDYFSERFCLDITPYDALLERYGLNINSVVDQANNEKQIEAIFENLKYQIIETSKTDTEYYTTYLKYQHLPNPDKSAIVDIGNRENIQSSISEMVKQKIGGYYMFTFVDMIENLKKQGMPVSGYVANFEEKKDFNYYLNVLFDSSDSYFSKFNLSDNMLNPIFEETEYPEQTKKIIEELQDGAFEFVSDFEKLFNKQISQMYFSSKQLFKPVDHILIKDNESNRMLTDLNTKRVVPKKEDIEININIDSEDIKPRNFDDQSGIFSKIGKFFSEIKKTL